MGDRGGSAYRKDADSPSLVAALLTRFVYPRFRASPFRGMGRLRPILPVPPGVRIAAFPGGLRLWLDLAESHQADLFFGLYDRAELSLLRRVLADGGDFVDIGAHIGFYTVAASQAVASRRGRVLAFEPNPAARAQLLDNLRLNGVEAEVVSKAVSNSIGTAMLHVPSSPDPSWSSLEARAFAEGEPIQVDLTTVDAEVGTRGLRPVFVKIDVEGHELAVLAGMERTIAEHRPIILCEVGEHSAHEAETMLERSSYRAFRVGRGRIVAGIGEIGGLFNVVFAPREHVEIVIRR